MVIDNEIDLEAGAAALKAWLITQPHLPQNIHPLLLKRYIHSTKGDLEYAKKIFIYGYTLRHNNPHIFGNRDPHEPKIQNVFKAIDMVPLPMVAECEDKFVYFRLIDCDPEKFHFNDVIRTFFMIADCRLVQPDIPMNGCDIPIFDMTDFTLRHLTKVILSTLRVYMKYTQEAHPVRLKAIHVINCNSFLDKVMYVLKPFMKKKVAEMLHFHLPNSEALYEHVPREVMALCDQAKITKQKADWSKRIESLREYITDDTRWKIDETRRTSNHKSQGTVEITGSLRKLEID